MFTKKNFFTKITQKEIVLAKQNRNEKKSHIIEYAFDVVVKKGENTYIYVYKKKKKNLQ